jgi:hypothetical protein
VRWYYLALGHDSYNANNNNDDDDDNDDDEPQQQQLRAEQKEVESHQSI